MAASRIFVPAILVTLAAIACGGGTSSSSSSSGGGFPFSGPSCPPGTTQPTGMQGSPACTQCVQTQCSTGCLASDCSAYFTCSCACNPNDSACAQGCIPKLAPACQTCLAGIEGCLFQTCGGACLGGVFDGGFAAHCSQLASCCSSLPTMAEQMACGQVVVGGNDGACQQALAMYGADGGRCH
jgi:hypothetical protein